MQVFFGEKCPCYDCWVAGEERCGLCKMCERQYGDSSECRYSAIPTSKPKYAIGQTVYYDLGVGFCSIYYGKIRKVEWDKRYQWEYTFVRERTPHGEDTLFATHQEAELAIIKKRGRSLMQAMKGYSDKYKIPLGEIKQQLLIDDGKQ